VSVGECTEELHGVCVRLDLRKQAVVEAMRFDAIKKSSATLLSFEAECNATQDPHLNKMRGPGAFGSLFGIGRENRHVVSEAGAERMQLHARPYPGGCAGALCRGVPADGTAPLNLCKISLSAGRIFHNT